MTADRDPLDRGQHLARQNGDGRIVDSARPLGKTAALLGEAAGRYEKRFFATGIDPA
jgi:hypothetical protein